jgi:hypothetical protein
MAKHKPTQATNVCSTKGPSLLATTKNLKKHNAYFIQLANMKR